MSYARLIQELEAFINDEAENAADRALMQAALDKVRQYREAKFGWFLP